MPANRPILLSLALIVLAILYLGGAAVAVLYGRTYMASVPGLTLDMLVGLVIGQAVGIAGCVLVWLWRPWGFLLLLAATITMIAIEVQYLHDPVKTARWAVTFLLIVIAARPHRERFRRP
jgi:hypothetical protein